MNGFKPTLSEVTDEHVSELRRLAAEWCDFATNGELGRTVEDSVYRWVTEGRDPGPKYSSCADLAHWLAYRLGCREEWINRAEHAGYVTGVNINRLVCYPIGSCPEADPVKLFNNAERRAFFRGLGRGDILITWTGQGANAHALVFDRFDADLVHSWDLGQGPMSADLWASNKQHLEARKRTRAMHNVPVRSVLRLDKLRRRVAVELPSGEYFDFVERGAT